MRCWWNLPVVYILQNFGSSTDVLGPGETDQKGQRSYYENPHDGSSNMVRSICEAKHRMPSRTTTTPFYRAYSSATYDSWIFISATCQYDGKKRKKAPLSRVTMFGAEVL